MMLSVMQSMAWAQGTGGGSAGSSTWLSLVPFVLIFVIFYFLLILPQQKRQKQQKALLDDLKKGDKVITASGIWGTVATLGKTTVTLQIARQLAAQNAKVEEKRAEMPEEGAWVRQHMSEEFIRGFMLPLEHDLVVVPRSELDRAVSEIAESFIERYGYYGVPDQR